MDASPADAGLAAAAFGTAAADAAVADSSADAPTAPVPAGAGAADADTPDATSAEEAVAGTEGSDPVRASDGGSAQVAAVAGAGDEPDTKTQEIVLVPPPGAEAAVGGSDSRRKWLIGGVVAAFVVVGGYLGAGYAMAETIPSGATVGGVPTDGQSEAELRAAVATRAAELGAQPFTLVAGDATATVEPGQAGLVIDPDASVGQLQQFTLNPAMIWRKIVGGGDYPMVTTVSEDALQSEVTAAAEQLDQAPVDGAIMMDGVTPQVTEAQEGQTVDVAGTMQAVQAQWPTSQEVEAPHQVTSPAISQQAIDDVMAAFITPALSGNVTIRAGAQEAALTPEQFGPALGVVPQDGALVPNVDGDTLNHAATEVNPAMMAEAKDASVKMVDGVPTVVPGVKGQKLQPESLNQQFAAAIASPERVAVVDVVEADPELTTEKLTELLVPAEMSKFDSKMPVNAVRTHNIALAAKTINGTLLMPGETFSMNDILGKRTPEKGYKAAPVIMDGRLARDYGGGISQMATTLFNGMFFAGLDEVEHKPHSFYISRYPEGREATINFPTVDLKFTNDTPKAVYIETWVSGQTVSTRFWGERQYDDVQAIKSKRSNIRNPKVLEDDSPGCVTQSPSPGFDVTVTRVMYKNGVEVNRESFRHRYIPEDKVTCTHGKPKPKPKPTPTPAEPAQPAQPTEPAEPEGE